MAAVLKKRALAEYSQIQVSFFLNFGLYRIISIFTFRKPLNYLKNFG